MSEISEGPEGKDINFVAGDVVSDDFGIAELGLDSMKDSALHELAAALTDKEQELSTQANALRERFEASEANGPSGTAEEESKLWHDLEAAEKALERNTKQIGAVYKAIDGRK